MDEFTCPECGKPTPIGKRGKPLAYCSKYCSNKRHLLAYKKRKPRTRERRQAEYFDRACIVCATMYRSSRPTGKFCSDQCKGQHYAANGVGMKPTRCKLPSGHAVMVLIAATKQAERDQREATRREAARSKFTWRTARECPGCACWFTPLYTSTTVCCSSACAKRCARRRRRAREHNARGSWVWSDFMRIAKKFDYCCAYCGIKPERLDPDHVVPLSRGGYDSPSNLLPTCLMCNSDKCAMTLSKWEVKREMQGKPARVTSWASEDSRYWHLTQAMLADISPAA